MNEFLNILRQARDSWKSFWAVNWFKTFKINYTMFPIEIARILPIYIYGPVKFANLKGTIKLADDVHSNMIRIGFNYEKDTLRKGVVELHISGVLEFKGYAQIAKDCFMYVGKNGHCTVGNMVGIASRSKLMCDTSITIGAWTRISAESQIYDTDFHEFVNIDTQSTYPMTGNVTIGSHNFIGYRVSIKKNTHTPDYCTVASNSLCATNYESLGTHILLGGVPAKKIKDAYTRVWSKEKQQLKSTFHYRDLH